MKQKIKKCFARTIPLLVIVCILVPCFAVPALAAGIDYNDLSPSIQVDGENDIVTFSFAPDQFWSYLYGGSYSGTAFNGSFTFDGKANVAYDIYTNLTPSYLETKNIPDDTLLSFSFRIVADSPAYSTPEVLLTYRYWRDGEVYDSLENNLGKGVINYTYTDSVSVFSSSYDGISFESGIWHLKPYYDGNISIIFDEMVFIMSINSAYRAALLSQENSQVIKEIEKQLAEQGKTMDQFLDQQEQTNEKLDNIINGEVTPDIPEGSDKVDDLDNAEGALRDQAQAGLDESLKVQQSALAILLEYAGSFAVFSWLFGLFADIPFLKGLLYVSMAVGLLASVLSIIQSASSFSSRHAPKEPSVKYHYHWHTGYRNKDKGE